MVKAQNFPPELAIFSTNFVPASPATTTEDPGICTLRDLDHLLGVVDLPQLHQDFHRLLYRLSALAGQHLLFFFRKLHKYLVTSSSAKSLYPLHRYLKTGIQHTFMAALATGGKRG